MSKRKRRVLAPHRALTKDLPSSEGKAGGAPTNDNEVWIDVLDFVSGYERHCGRVQTATTGGLHSVMRIQLIWSIDVCEDRFGDP